MIELRNISKKFGERIIFENFSLKIKKGEFVCIMGKSGVGKTTLLNLIALLDKPDSGDVVIGLHTNPNKKVSMDLRRNVLGYIFQNYLLMDNETVKKNLLISKTYNKNFSEKFMNETLNRLGMDKNILNKKVYQLSGGEQQRIAISRVILKPHELVLADEPTGNLDIENKKIIMSLFKELKEKGKTIVCVTHDKELANNADRIITIEKYTDFN